MKLVEDLGVIPISEGSKNRARFGIYECSDCLAHFRANTAKVKSRNTEVCPLCAKDGRHKVTHGGTGSRLHTVWNNMKARCYKEYSTSYKHYGKRGIGVCDEWKDDFSIFREWAISNGYNDTLEIDREDSDLDYLPSNCRWVTNAVQSANRVKNYSSQNTYAGIYPHNNKWKLMIGVHGTPTYLGLFPSEVEAAVCRNNYIIKHNLPNKLCNIKETI